MYIYTIFVLTNEEKKQAIEATQFNKNDTGSSAVQVSLLSKRIDQLNGHLKTNHKDRHCRKGLLGLITERRKHLDYLKRKNIEVYKKTINTLGLRK